MSVFDRIFTESYDKPGEAEAIRRGDSASWLKRTQARGPRSTPSAAAGKWSYNAVEQREGAQFTKWMPPARMAQLASSGQTIGVRQESLEEVSSRIDTILEAVFPEDD
jgi:hypothetical protein